MGARIVLNTWGSFGDVHPYMAVALELRARGHRPVIATMDVYREHIEAANLLITHPAAPAGPLVGRKTGMPWISTVLAPLSFFSVYDPPIPPVMQWTTRL